MLHKKLTLLSLLSLCFLYPASAQEYRPYQLHVRTGMFSATFNRPYVTEGGSQSTSREGLFLEESVSLITTFDFEFEFFTNDSNSWLARGLIVHDFSLSRLSYMSVGMGKRFYFFSHGMAKRSLSNEGDRVVIMPKWRFYGGADLGMSRVVVGNFGPVLEIASALVEAGVHLGSIYQVSPSVGIEVYLGASYGFGFSTVTVSSLSTRIFTGVVLAL